MIQTIETTFFTLCDQVKNCTVCPRMANSTRILGPSSGSLEAKIMFIGEAPGRLGADGSGIPFHGDKSGHNFEELLKHVGISRYEIFITNAVLCNPKDDKGNNSTPNKTEVANCSHFLKEQIELINPRIIVTLGATALEALSYISSHSLSLRVHVRTMNKWNDRILIPLYHPGQRAMMHRSYHNQLSDYQFVAEQLKKLDKSQKRKAYGTVKENLLPVLKQILCHNGSISYFALHKLFFLIEYNAVKKLSDSLTHAYFVRQKDGPYCTDLHITKIRRAMPGLEIKNKNDRLYLHSGRQLSLMNDQVTSLTNEQEVVVKEVLKKYGHIKNDQLKTAVYMTRPMRKILHQEKRLGLNMYNKPIHLG